MVVKDDDDEDGDERVKTLFQDAKQPRYASSLPGPSASGAQPNNTSSKIQYPKSLSVADMLKLGKVINLKSTTTIELWSFDLKLMSWLSTPQRVDFIVEKTSLGQGAFREAFKATSNTSVLTVNDWVVKKYLPKALEVIQATNQSTEQHTRKTVQMHTLAQNFASQLRQELITKGVLDLYGKTLTFNKLFLGKIEATGEFVTVEEFVPGNFVKYVNNDGLICSKDSDMRQKAESLPHFSFIKSKEELMVLDIQGSVSQYKLFDPEIASMNLTTQSAEETLEEYLFCTGNLSHIAINAFKNNHKCNSYCRLIDLQAF